MLLLDILAALIFLCILFLVYCFIGFSRAQRSKRCPPTSAYLPKVFPDNPYQNSHRVQQRSSEGNETQAVDLSGSEPGIIQSQRDHTLTAEQIEKPKSTRPLAKSGVVASERVFALQNSAVSRRRQSVEKLRFLIARRRMPKQGCHGLGCNAKYSAHF